MFIEQPKVLIFDLDNTLIWDEKSTQEAFEATSNYASAAARVDPSELTRFVQAEADRMYRLYDTYEFASMIEVTALEAMWARFDEGEHPMLRRLEQLAPAFRFEAWESALRLAGMQPPIGRELVEQLSVMFMQERRKRPYVYDDTIEVLEKLKRHYRLLLLTNGTPDLQQEKIDMGAGLADYFDDVIISGHFGEGKPRPAIFHHAAERAGCGAADCIMIGDNPMTDILGANRAGMRSVWLNRSGRPSSAEAVPTFEAATLTELALLLQPM